MKEYLKNKKLSNSLYKSNNYIIGIIDKKRKSIYYSCYIT